MLAGAIKADMPYHISCPALLICGEKDKAGSAKSYNKKWHQREGLPLKWIKNAGHNSNTDQPDEVNRLIEKYTVEKSIIWNYIDSYWNNIGCCVFLWMNYYNEREK